MPTIPISFDYFVFYYFYPMLYIANPIYDAVFKFMMEDKEVAKRFIGIIIGKTILEIQLLPQEKTYFM